jgi:F-type H+-transporting ATPase subunit a
MPNSQTQTTDLRFTPRGSRFPIGRVAALALAASLMGPGAGSTFAQSEAGTTKSALAASAEPEEHSVSQKAVEIARPFGFPITNSMAVSWIVAVALIMFARVATRDMKRVPSGAQNLLEWLVGGLYDFLERIIGPRLVKRTFWFFATVFIFILSAN